MPLPEAYKFTVKAMVPNMTDPDAEKVSARYLKGGFRPEVFEGRIGNGMLWPRVCLTAGSNQGFARNTALHDCDSYRDTGTGIQKPDYLATIDAEPVNHRDPGSQCLSFAVRNRHSRRHDRGLPSERGTPRHRRTGRCHQCQGALGANRRLRRQGSGIHRGRWPEGRDEPLPQD